MLFRIASAALLVSALAAAQDIDLSSLEKLAKRATESNTISLDGDNLRTASRFLTGNNPDMQQVKSIVDGLKGIWVRNFSFKDNDEYGKGDLAPVRRQLQGSGWSKVLESRDKESDTEVYLRADPQKAHGLAIIAQEPKELTVVVISGAIDLEKLGKLGGSLGIPDVEMKHPKKDAPPGN